MRVYEAKCCVCGDRLKIDDEVEWKVVGLVEVDTLEALRRDPGHYLAPLHTCCGQMAAREARRARR